MKKDTMSYKHLSKEQRYQIETLHRQKWSCARIGREIGCHGSSVSRELKRNVSQRGYRGGMVDEKAKARQSITFDNGKEFAEHARIAKTLKAKVYFARPYHSWEWGLNENTNGLLRQYFPKSTNLLSVSDCDVDEAVYQLNHRPRKCLGYRTPHEVFYDLDISPSTLPSDALCT